jgi:hypothetical protein
MCTLVGRLARLLPFDTFLSPPIDVPLLSRVGECNRISIRHLVCDGHCAECAFGQIRWRRR